MSAMSTYVSQRGSFLIRTEKNATRKKDFQNLKIMQIRPYFQDIQGTTYQQFF